MFLGLVLDLILPVNNTILAFLILQTKKKLIIRHSAADFDHSKFE